MKASAANLGVLLGELGIESRHQVAAGILLIAVFEVSFVGLAVAQAAGEYWLRLPPVAVVAAVWVVWTCWHSWLFPRNRLAYLGLEHPYRTAFVRDIYPWVTLGFCQMWRPLFNGETVARLVANPAGVIQTPPVVGIAGAVTLSLAALVTMILAIRSIGIANAAFVPEFHEVGTFVPVERGIYAHFAHPLFWSGIAFSLALAIATSTRTAFAIAGVNLLYGVCYGPLERRRLGRVFGTVYTSYATRLGGLPTTAVYRKLLNRAESRRARADGRTGADRER